MPVAVRFIFAFMPLPNLTSLAVFCALFLFVVADIADAAAVVVVKFLTTDTLSCLPLCRLSGAAATAVCPLPLFLGGSVRVRVCFLVRSLAVRMCGCVGVLVCFANSAMSTQAVCYRLVIYANFRYYIKAFLHHNKFTS